MRNWLLITAALFAGSALVYAIRVRRAEPTRVSTASISPRARGRSRGLDRRWRLALPWAGLAGAAAVVVAGLWIKHAAGGLGTPLPPFLMAWDAQRRPARGRVSVGVLAGGGAARAGARRSGALAVAVRRVLYLLALALGLSLNLARSGADGLVEGVRDRRARLVRGPLRVSARRCRCWTTGPAITCSHFASLFPYMTTHVKGNPPGPLVALHVLGIERARRHSPRSASGSAR